MDEPTKLSADLDGRLRLGTVPFLNALPLTFGLDERADVVLRRWPPAQLPAALDADRLDGALVPAIDYQRTASQWSILPVGAIGSRGPVLTVQVFARCPLDRITTLAVDTDSHTSIALAAIIWRLRYSNSLHTTALDPNGLLPDAVLLIGDKVLAQIQQWPHQLDLGLAWHELTGLPFVYAFWVVRHVRHAHSITAILENARRQGTHRMDHIISRHAQAHGFDQQLARRYLTRNLCYDLGPDQIQGLNKFYQLAYDLGLTDSRRALQLTDANPSVASSVT